MVLNRQALESKLLQQLLAHPELNLVIWSDEELLASIKATLQQKSTDELWIFAYGSLIWNPLFDYLERRVVTIEGWQRQFCLVAPVGRGTIANPGLVLGLEPGDRCQGIAYRLAVDDNLESELLLLWRREMVIGSYVPTWITATNGDRSLSIYAIAK
ncbi:gamma-glutamylcyclotransferase [Pleurocapsa sp. FMAR1]|uniref:gamma-glutamylcyclotransferase n=1 Tax=Pleurocapsa sp. FMAR1 TaxID=3040204 RepID=UPI0029C8D0BC|nr:gamma-glutamylcyclotransferase [Pleurocapsa sp. FMAR1]